MCKIGRGGANFALSASESEVTFRAVAGTRKAFAVRALRAVPRPLYRILKRAPLMSSLGRRALDALLGRSGVAATRIEGGPLAGMVVELQPRVNKDMLLGRYEPEVCDALEALLSTGDAAFDVGAHLGYMSLMMALCVGAEGRVVAFEPDPIVGRILQKNLERNRSPALASLDVLPVAVGEAAGPSSFARGVTTGVGTLVADSGDFEVPVMTLDRAADSVVRPDLVKIDTEGTELATGSTSSDARDRKSVV